MNVVDSSVWIAALRAIETEEVRKLRELVQDEDDAIVVGDLVMLEVLQGARDETHAALIERSLRRFRVSNMLDGKLAVQAAINCRSLRRRGTTVRKTIDVITGTFCIEAGHVLLHDDRDFDPMVQHLGLRVA